MAGGRSFQFSNSSADSHQGRQVPAGGHADDNDASRVISILILVGTQPSQCPLAIMDLCRERSLMTHSILDTGHGVSVRGDPTKFEPLAVATLPATAMNEHDEWRISHGLRRFIEGRLRPPLATECFLESAARRRRASFPGVSKALMAPPQTDPDAESQRLTARP